MIIEKIYPDLKDYPHTIKDDYEQFLQDVHSEQLEKYESNEIPYFTINLKELYNYDEDLYNEVTKKNPKESIVDFNVVIKEKTGRDVNVRFEEAVEETKISNLDDKEVGQLVSVTGIIPSKTDVNPKGVELVFECRNCGNSPIRQIQYDTETTSYPECDSCGNKQPKNFVEKVDQFSIVNYQRLKMQETPEESKSKGKPMSRDLDLYGKVAGEVDPGERITVHGILDARGSKTESGRLKNTVFDYFVNAISIDYKEKNFEDLEVTAEDEQKIKELAKRDDIYEVLSANIAPTIKGKEIKKIKEGIVYQLFSGVTKHDNSEASRIRGDIHILIVGDPGTGKSQVLQFVGSITPRGKYSSGKSTTEAGLTAAAVANDDFGGGTWTLEAGVLPKSDGGIACIDEFDKMSSNDRNSMHEALEQQKLDVNKAGISATMNTRTALLAAANPEDGRFNEFKKVVEQIDLEPAMFSRFDIIFTLQDTIDKTKDTNIASNMIESNRMGELNEESDNALKEIVDADIYIEQEDYKKYIAYARNNCRPVLNEKAMEVIKDFYIKFRQKGKTEGDEEDKYPITARKLEALIRIAEASARIRLDEEVRKEDAERAKSIMKASLDQVARDPESGDFDIDSLENTMNTRERSEINDLRGVITYLLSEEGRELSGVEGVTSTSSRLVIEKEEIIDKAVDDLDMSRSKAKSKLKDLKQQGSVFEPKHGYFAK